MRLKGLEPTRIAAREPKGDVTLVKIYRQWRRSGLGSGLSLPSSDLQALLEGLLVEGQELGLGGELVLDGLPDDIGGDDLGVAHVDPQHDHVEDLGVAQLQGQLGDGGLHQLHVVPADVGCRRRR